ncbi:MAG: heme exporter protein CcmB [Solirubrobacteraceae bacterium]
MSERAATPIREQHPGVPEADASASARSAAPPRRQRLTATALTLLRKELLIELRTLESVPAMVLFALGTFVVFHFALNRGSVEGDLAAGLLWVTILFAALLGVNRLFVVDADQGGFDALLLAPVDPSAMLLAKVAALCVYLVALEVVAVPGFGLLLLGSSLGSALPSLLAVLALADLGLAAIGTFVAAIAVRTSARDLIGPLIALPLLVPIAIGASRASAPLLSSVHHGGLELRWLALLGVYDLLFGLIAYAVFDFLLED